MAAEFDPDDRESWYFGQLGRRITDQLLMNETEGGIFLIRDSQSLVGDYVLCVREGNRVAHYIINQVRSADDTNITMLKIGDKQFASLPELLRFYKMHYLDTTPLIRPAQKILAKVKANFNFDGKDPDDLPFRKGEILYIIARDEEQWWTARNAQGDIGSVPLPYLHVVEEAQKPEGLLPEDLFESSSAGQNEQNAAATANGNGSSKSSLTANSGKPVVLNGNNTASAKISSGTTTKDAAAIDAVRSSVPTGTSGARASSSLALPARARVIKCWNKPYDETQLNFDVGTLISVTALNADGTCDGELNGKKGKFPLNCIEWID